MKKLTRDTTLACITRGRSGFDIRTFECPECDHFHQSAQAALASEWELARAGNVAECRRRPSRSYRRRLFLRGAFLTLVLYSRRFDAELERVTQA
jgi:hypothetical protein